MMKTEIISSCSRLLKNLPSVPVVWQGRTISLLAKGLGGGALLTAAAVVAYLAYRGFLEVLTSYQLAKYKTIGLFAKYQTITATQSEVPSIGEIDKLMRIFSAKDPLLKSGLYAKYNKDKDRYDNILQLKKPMVKVEIGGAEIDYNGAKFVNPENGRVYILMQGPRRSTVDDTKAMMEQNNVKQIVCLTRDVDDKGIVKCFPYWKETKEKEWKTTQEGGFSIRTPLPGEGWPSELEMLHYENWPDHGVPKNIDEFINFVKLQRKMYKDGASAVHCSGGIGRTGVFMVVIWMMDQIAKGCKELDPVEIITQLREFRSGLVENEEQLKFCFDVANYLLQESSQ